MTDDQEIDFTPAPAEGVQPVAPAGWVLVSPLGNVMCEPQQCPSQAWAVLCGTYKTTLEGILGYEQVGWTVAATPPAGAAGVPLSLLQENARLRAIIETHEGLARLLRMVLDDIDTCYGESGPDWDSQELSSETMDALRAYREGGRL